jgi:copper chaperone CopZ
MKNINRLKIIVALLLLVNLTNLKAQIIKAEIRATGLTCSMCSNAINKQLKTINQVINVETDLNTNTFTVSVSKDNNLTPNIFKEKVEKAGFFIGSLIITVPTIVTRLNAYIFVENESSNADEVQIKILDKGYVTNKEYKKLLKSLKKIETYSLDNENDFHVKIIKI